MSTFSNDTICALASASGGAIAIIRISGPKAISAVGSICPGLPSDVQANTIRFARVYKPVETTGKSDEQKQTDQGELIDEVMIAVFRAPHSYTGEDSVEISCHGSSYIIQQIIELLIRNGCRMASPGEYTLRAYLNGKLDLSQAEAVADLIASTNKATHKIAMSQLRGSFSTELSRLREQLLKLTSLLELELDFSDHEELEFANRTELLELALTIDHHITTLANSFEFGQAIKQGIPVALIGKTNVGKSTLLNQLLKEDRAIVSNVHGTTRDTIEDAISINGVSFRYIDTAGLRQTTDAIEQIGIERTYKAIARSRIVIWIVDTQPTPDAIDEITELTKNKALIIVRNKIDLSVEDYSIELPPALQPDALLYLSAQHGVGIKELEAAIYEAANIPSLTDSDVIVTNARHYEALTAAHHSIINVINGLNNNMSGDLLAEDLRLTLNSLGEITGGQITTDETLGNIFKHFCVGK